VDIVGQTSTRPVASAVVEALDDGNVVAATTTDDAGRYELRVPPGTYLIRATAEGLHSKGPGRTITIFAGETMDLRFVLDTGIRCRWGHQPAMCPLGAQCRWAMGVE
jgi:carboxypeptidase family protein